MEDPKDSEDKTGFFTPSVQSFFQDERQDERSSGDIAGDIEMEVPSSSRDDLPREEEEEGVELLPEHSKQQKRRRSWEFLKSTRGISMILALLLLVILVPIVSVYPSRNKARVSSMSSITDTVKGTSNGNGTSANAYDNANPNSSGSLAMDPKDASFFTSRIPPFSTLDPVYDLNLYRYERPANSSPNSRLGPLSRKALPTNAWYQNLLRLGLEEEPTRDHRAYTIPYVIDVAGDIPGVRIHGTRLDATPSQITVTVDEPYALILGAMADGATQGTSLGKGYEVHQATDLGITLQWEAFDMKSTLARGSPYVTMVYNGAVTTPSAVTARSLGLLPTVYSQTSLSDSPIADTNRRVNCESGEVFRVEEEVQLNFVNGQRWVLFVSDAIDMKCQSNQGGPTILQVVPDNNDTESPLIIRAALIMPSMNSESMDGDEAFATEYLGQLRSSKDLFPGELTSVSQSFDVESGTANYAKISFDWDPQSMNSGSGAASDMIMFALPHHKDLMGASVMTTLCTPSLIGPVCLAKGTTWDMVEQLPVVDFQAPRHPDPSHIPAIAAALKDDIRYQIPTNFQIGAGDTYFSGKTVAKLARILLIAEELKDLCELSYNSEGTIAAEYAAACNGLELPSDEDFKTALDQLRGAVTVWIKNNDQAPWVYDGKWGGLVSCGCLYSDGICTNQFPDCPAFTDQGLNFGNGWYNDHHFHYGYHIYSAAVLAHYDEEWAMENYEHVLLLVRDFANPSDDDSFFPAFRHKDWFRGHSWANGFTNPKFFNVMNQESSSEAIASYEATALFGKVMSSIFKNNGDTERASAAEKIHNIGLTLTATEVRSTKKYWHVLQNVDDSERIYPSTYEANVVGIMWSTFVQFSTWFGTSPYLIYGIQLLPLTPISESYIDLRWAKEMYAPLAASCDQGCVAEGWSIQLFAILATIGHADMAVQQTLKLSPSVYEGPGGNGHSVSNTLWYIATRPFVDEPYPKEKVQLIEIRELTCSQPATCTREYLDSMAGEYSCRSRIEWLMHVEDMPEIMACAKIAGEEYQSECGLCLPGGSNQEADQDNDTGSEESVNNDSHNNVPPTNDSPVPDPVTDTTNDGTLTCLQPTICTNEVLNRMAGGHTCRARIQYLMESYGRSEESACQQVAGEEFPSECGGCLP